MSIGLQATPTTPPSAEPVGPTYPLSEEQFEAMFRAGILTDADGVELRDGLLVLADPAGDDPADVFYRLSVDQYHRMIDPDILTSDDRVELLEGWLAAKMPNHPPHRRGIERTHRTLAPLVGPDWYVTMQQSVTTGASEPEPDVAVVRGSTDDYPDRHPGPGDLALVVEVADSSLRTDRKFKRALYAGARFPAYWILNLVDRRLEAHSEPSGPAERPDYRKRQDYGPDDLVPLLIEGREVARVAVRDLLP